MKSPPRSVWRASRTRCPCRAGSSSAARPLRKESIMNVKEIREKETEHLKHELEEKRKHLFDLRSQAVTEKLEDPSQLKKTRKDIARMITVLKQRETESQQTTK